jgi:predicted GNAT family acetyltransferase
MEDVSLSINALGAGEFFVKDSGTIIARMTIRVQGHELIVYHTEVLPEREGQGWAKKLLEAMVLYAREKKLMVIPLCPFVHAEFSAHPAEYSDIWRQFKK